MLILQVDRTVLPTPKAIPDVHGVEISAVSLPGEDASLGSLLLVLKDSSYADIFQSLVCDLVEVLALTETDGEAVNLFLNRIRKWQRFLEISQSEGLSDEAQQGLYGELWFLREQILPYSGACGVRYWNGGKRTPQDFQLPRGAVEVKTTLASSHPFLKIHGVRQLDETSVPRLLLCHLAMERKSHQGETLVAIVETIFLLLENCPDVRDHFDTLLLDAGYHNCHRDRYEECGYAVRRKEMYLVHGEFPRIRESEIRNGIGKIEYSIDVAVCRDFQVSFEEIATLLSVA